MSLIITFMFDPAKLQMNCASASGASSLRVETERRATSTGRTHHGRGNRSRTRGARGVGNHGAARLFSLVISMGSSAACSAVARPNCDQVAQLSPPLVGGARSVPPPPSAPLSRRGPKSGPACQRSSTEWRSLATRIGCDPPCARSPSCSPEDRFDGLLPIVVLDLADRLEADRARWPVGHATQHCRSFRLGRSFACIAVAVVRPGAVEHGGILPFELAVVEHPTLAQAAEALQ